MSLNVVILAAGQGKRMYSRLPKVLHRLAGLPLLAHVLGTASTLQPARLVVVYGHGGEQVHQAFEGDDIQWVLQQPQLGTGDALRLALPALDPELPTLVLYGDVPLVQQETLARLLQETAAGTLGLLTVRLAEPAGYGRIVRSPAGQVVAIVEDKDTTPEQSRIQEVNTGIMVLPTARLGQWLSALSNQNAQGEYYLTDVVAQAVSENIAVHASITSLEWEVQGVNNQQQLAMLERVYQLEQARQLLLQGVALADPARIDIRGSLECGQDVRIDVGCIFEGRVVLEAGVELGPYCVIRNSLLKAGTKIGAYTHIDSGEIGPQAVVGPYARIRPGTELAAGAHIGNFVEVKNSRIGAESKANHLAYLGDTDVGERVNIGAGTITCNYDGVNKYRTVIEDEAFIGSDSQLIAPVRVGRGATLAAGTTLTADAPAGALTLTRVPQVSVSSWKRPQKQEG